MLQKILRANPARPVVMNCGFAAGAAIRDDDAGWPYSGIGATIKK
jgi:hypothetical protein